MATPRPSKRVQGQVEARGAAVLTVQEGPLLLGYGATSMVVSGFAPTLRNNMALTPRYRRIAVRPEAPEDAAWNDGSAVATTTPFTQAFSLAGLGAFMFVQPAMGGSSSTSNGEGFSVWTAFTNSTAQIVVRQTVQLQPDLNAGGVAFIPLGRPFPSLDLSGVMVAAPSSARTTAVSSKTMPFDLSAFISPKTVDIFGTPGVVARTDWRLLL